MNADFDARFPADTLARVTVAVTGRHFVSGVTAPRGEASDPLSSAELEAKFRAAARFSLTEDHQDRILAAMNKAYAGDISKLILSIK